MKRIIFAVLIVHSSLLIVNAQWQPDFRLTNDSSGSSTSFNNAWCIASSGSVIHVVWREERNLNTEIYYKRSTDGGVSWGSDTRLTYNSSFSFSPSIAVSGSFVHVVWYDFRDVNWEIYYKHSTDGGINWGEDTRLTVDLGNSEYPSIAVSNQSVHVIWVDFRNTGKDVYYKHSTDGGFSWGTDSRLTSDSNSAISSISVSGQVVHVVWEHHSDIFYKRSIDGGTSWQADVRLTNNIASSRYPCISAQDKAVHVVWYDDRDGNPEIYYKRSLDTGASWGADIRLTFNSSYSNLPSIAVSGQGVHIVWYDYRDGPQGNDEIYYKRSTDGGVNWETDTRLTNNTAISRYPSVSVSGQAVHVVWYDTRDGNSEIYYKRDPTGNPLGINIISSEIPSGFSLSQNYPNPFNPSTKIRFDIPSVGQRHAFGVRLIIYDVLGREVATLFNEQLSPGIYEVEWNASNYPSGVYYYELQTEGFTETKKMVLVK